MRLRPYQSELVARCEEAFAVGARSVVLQAATGSGKTRTAAAVIGQAVAKGRRVVFAAHLDTLVSDTHARLTEAGVAAGFVQAGRPSDPTARVQVASLGTLHARSERPPADLLILDECHRALAGSVRGILADYPTARILGLTATPQRGDGQPLGDVFDAMVCGPSVRQLTREGHLVPCDVLAPAEPTEALVSEPVDAYLEHLAGKRTLVFASTIEHAEWIAHGLNARGVPAAVVTGETPRERRAELRQAVRDGSILVLLSVQVFVEGWDEPSIEGIVLAREFSVCGSFLQAIGRGLRPSPSTGKERCTVVDLRGAVNLHGLPDEDRVWSLDGKPKRTEKLPSLRRCLACAAIFRPSVACPRCGVVAEPQNVTQLPRVLSRGERLERISSLSQDERDRRYLYALARVAMGRMRMPKWRAEAWARTQFERKFGRQAA